MSDEPSFLNVVRGLAVDRETEVALEKFIPSLPFEAGPLGLEAGTIAASLGAALRWAEATRFGASQGLSNSNPWRRFVVFLYCGKIYK